jgi:hypothetical protein
VWIRNAPPVDRKDSEKKDKVKPPEKDKSEKKGGFFSSVFATKSDKKPKPAESSMVRSGSNAMNLSGAGEKKEPSASTSAIGGRGIKPVSSSTSIVADVAQLVDMGYSQEVALNAVNTAGSFEDAAALLLAADDATRRGPMSVCSSALTR